MTRQKTFEKLRTTETDLTETFIEIFPFVVKKWIEDDSVAGIGIEVAEKLDFRPTFQCVGESMKLLNVEFVHSQDEIELTEVCNCYLSSFVVESNMILVEYFLRKIVQLLPCLPRAWKPHNWLVNVWLIVSNPKN